VQDRHCVPQDARHGPFAQLDDVAQQHEVVGILDRVEERLEDGLVAPQQVAAAREAEVEVGDDRCAHPPIFARRGWLPCIATALNSLFCRHNRFTADCPICSKGTVLDGGAAGQARPRAAKPRAARAAAAPAQFRGPYAGAGPYEVGDGRFDVRLEKVPGGLRLGRWSGGSLERAAPILRAADVPELVAAARERAVLAGRDQDAFDTALRAEPGEPAAVVTSTGRAGDMREELRLEALEEGMVRLARWLYRPNQGWELQDAPVMLPAKRYAEVLSKAVRAGLVPSTTAVSPSTSRSTFTTPT
jgi:hypothetical protein